MLLLLCSCGRSVPRLHQLATWETLRTTTSIWISITFELCPSVKCTHSHLLFFAVHNEPCLSDCRLHLSQGRVPGYGWVQELSTRRTGRLDALRVWFRVAASVQIDTSYAVFYCSTIRLIIWLHDPDHQGEANSEIAGATQCVFQLAKRRDYLVSDVGNPKW